MTSLEQNMITLNGLLAGLVDPTTQGLNAVIEAGSGDPITAQDIFSTTGPVAGESVEATAIKVNNILAKSSDGAAINTTIEP